MQDLNEAGQSIQSKIKVLIDLDPRIGRTGIKSEDALNFALKIEQFNWLNLIGIQCYAGNFNISPPMKRDIVAPERSKSSALEEKDLALKGLPETKVFPKDWIL